ncbi:hypothetical protein Dimus_013434, partial [Dionaea muscipula]
MRINGTAKSAVASNLAESIFGASTIRAFGKEEQFFSKAVEIIDKDAAPFFHNFSANEWLILYLEVLCALILSASALALTLFPFKGSALDEIVENNRPASNWPIVGKVEFCNLKVKYRPSASLVLHGINCAFEGGSKIGIVGRTGSGKTTLISTLFRLVEPTEGNICIDSIDIMKIGLHDFRSHLGIIPQDPTLFSGFIRYNLDPLSEHTDQEVWEVLHKCQLRNAVCEKGGLDSS